MKFNYILRPTDLTLIADNVPYPVPATDSRFKKLKELIRAKKFDAAFKMINPVNYMHGKVEVKGNNVFFNGLPLHNAVVDRIKLYMKERLPYKPLLKFTEKLMQNETALVRDNLFAFLEDKKIQITENGNFLAYKGVSSDYKDKHTGTFDNQVGANPPRLDRNQVDSNPNNGCSFGYHVGSYNYAKGFGEKLMVVEVNPLDVVSVPNDENFQKCRVTYYEVIDECKEKEHLATKVYKVKNRRIANRSGKKSRYHRDANGRFVSA